LVCAACALTRVEAQELLLTVLVVCRGGGYDWLGSETSVSARGLKMPRDYDLFGEKYPRDGPQNPEFDEVMFRCVLVLWMTLYRHTPNAVTTLT